MLTYYSKKLSWIAGIILLSLPVIPLHAQTVLTATEQGNLEFMREEEKLARDIYTHLYGIWGTPIFNTISISEQRHMNAVLSSLDFYGIADPAEGNAAGVFTNTALQQLYDDLIAQAESSEISALEVGIIVEETDISDLETSIGSTSRPDIIRLYNNLLKGSLNHLSAFTNNLEFLGGNNTGGNSGGNTLAEGTAVYEPISETLYIPAVDVMDESGAIIVYDVLLRLIETLPQALEVVSATETSKLANSAHASFDISSGILNIPDLSVGALQLSVDSTRYTATLKFTTDTGIENIFVVTQIQEK